MSSSGHARAVAAGLGARGFDDLEVRIEIAQEEAQALPEERVVVDDQDPHAATIALFPLGAN